MLDDFSFSIEYSYFIVMDYVSWLCTSIEFGMRAYFSYDLATQADLRRSNYTNGLDNEQSFLSATRARSPRRVFLVGVWFYIGLMSIFPFEYVGLSADGSLAAYYLPRLLGTLRIGQYLETVSYVMEEKGWLRNIGLQRMWALFLAMAFSGHICGCLFYAVSLQDATDGIEATWGQVDGLWRISLNATTEEYTVEYIEPLAIRYLRSVYWAYVTMVTTGVRVMA